MSNTISLSPSHSRHTSSKPPTHTFDRILTGSDNKSVYSLTAKAHVRAAMEGYNAVVFAYGQTASGKTFTLVSPLMTRTHPVLKNPALVGR
jgi:centromeric protein E